MQRVWPDDLLGLLGDLAFRIRWQELGTDRRGRDVMQRFLPKPDLTILLDIAPETAVQRKAQGRDRYERDLNLLSRVRDSYRRQAASDNWLVLDGERPRNAVSEDVVSAVEKLLARR